MNRYQEFCGMFSISEVALVRDSVSHDSYSYLDALHHVDTVPREQMQQALFELGHALYMAVNDHMEGYDIDGDFTLSNQEIRDAAFDDDARERAADLAAESRGII